MIYRKPKVVELIYFTGTGGTKRVADEFESGFRKNGLEVWRHEIDHRNKYTAVKSDLLVVLFPVYALNAPEPVYELIKELPIRNGIPAVVISVSGGGETTPNLASRLHAIRRLRERGFRTRYENMIVMPSNILVQTPESLSIRLLEVLPRKVEHMIHEILTGVIRRTKPNLFNRMLSCFGELEKTRLGGRLVGRFIRYNEKCNGCGSCQRNCPTGNISMRSKSPVFDGKCALCLRCIYGCPQKALRMRVFGFVILKQGYRLENLDHKTSVLSDSEIDKLTLGFGYSGIRKYLREA